MSKPAIRGLNSFKAEIISYLNKFTKDEKAIFDAIYKMQATTGILNPPAEMFEWIVANFGSLAAVKVQDFVKLTNIVTYEGAIFNELRTNRPMVGDDNFSEVLDEIQQAYTDPHPFATPLTGTPEDSFGRIKGKYCITASNIAKYDGFHGLIIYDNPNPLLFSRKRVIDYFAVATKWFAKAHETNKEAIYPLYTWNCLWKAGASIIHGHSQIALTEGMAYSKVEEMRYTTLKYQEANRRNYYDDVFMIHKKLGLGLERDGIRLMVKITPIKEKEVMFFAPEFNDKLASLVSDVLNVFKERLGVASFNLAVVLPPMAKTPEVWDHMPVVVRIVDRGKLTVKTVDIGGMELYAQSIVASNPYAVMKELRASLL